MTVEVHYLADIFTYFEYCIGCFAGNLKLESWVDGHNTKWKILIADLAEPCILYHRFEIFLEK